MTAYRKYPKLTVEETKELRYLANCIRGLLRLEPLYKDGEHSRRSKEDELRRAERRVRRRK